MWYSPSIITININTIHKTSNPAAIIYTNNNFQQQPNLNQPTTITQNAYHAQNPPHTHHHPRNTLQRPSFSEDTHHGP
jgi:hypothetical protein